MQLLADMLQDFIDPGLFTSPVWITGLTDDSRQVEPGMAFLAYPGDAQDGRGFIDQALSRGAAAIISEPVSSGLLTNQHRIDSLTGSDGVEVPLVPISDLRSNVSRIAGRFYQQPSAQLTVMGVTGTNGKTSCSSFIAASLNLLHQRCALMGTLGNGFVGKLEPSGLTTPNAISVQRHLAAFRDQAAQAVVMEVSSHGLAQGRVNDVVFDTAVFTNLTHDHLDYHGSMAQYAEAKRRLFYLPGVRYAVINIDDDYGRALANELVGSLHVIGYTTEQRSLDGVDVIAASDIQARQKGVRFRVTSPWGGGQVSTGLLGEFNVGNLLASLGCLITAGVTFSQAIGVLGKLKGPAGRMQAFGGGKQQPLVVVDYAHTPDALEQALKNLRAHCQRKLWCVFGCGGDRDRDKRPLMAQVAERYSDHLIVTDDNPRHEDPEQIVADVMSGLLCGWAAEVVHSRPAAIAQAVNQAVAGDVVLIAGKGHETFQLVGDEQIPTNDIEQVKTQLSMRTVTV